jgi:hypothetical protein
MPDLNGCETPLEKVGRLRTEVLRARAAVDRVLTLGQSISLPNGVGGTFGSFTALQARLARKEAELISAEAECGFRAGDDVYLINITQ